MYTIISDIHGCLLAELGFFIYLFYLFSIGVTIKPGSATTGATEDV